MFALLQLMSEKDHYLGKAAYEYFRSASSAHWDNLFITRWELFSEYCEFLFDLLFELERRLSPSDYQFLRNHLRVLKTPEDGALCSPDNVLITDQGTKVICRLNGLEEVAMGNHDATHEGTTVQSTHISIAHYPLRTYNQFAMKVHNHGSSIANSTRFGADINWHLRRWFEQLQNEYLKYVIADELKRNLSKLEFLLLTKNLGK